MLRNKIYSFNDEDHYYLIIVNRTGNYWTIEDKKVVNNDVTKIFWQQLSIRVLGDKNVTIYLWLKLIRF